MTQHLIKIFLFFSLLITGINSHADFKFSKDVQKRINFFNKSCEDKDDPFKKTPEERPNTLILVDATDPLQDDQKQFIVDNFIENFNWNSSGEKVSVVMLNGKSLSNMDYLTICTPISESEIKATMAVKKLKQKIKLFNQGFIGGFNELTESKETADQSQIIESFVELFRNKRYGFLEGKRKLIIASDLYQNSEFLSFYKMCTKKNCESFDQSLKNKEFKNFLDSMLDLKGVSDVDIEVFHLKTKNRVNLKSKDWWESFLKYAGFEDNKIKVNTQL